MAQNGLTYYGQVHPVISNCGQLWPILSKYIRNGQIRFSMNNYSPICLGISNMAIIIQPTRKHTYIFNTSAFIYGQKNYENNNGNASI